MGIKLIKKETGYSKPENMEVILWANLIALRNNNQLIPGTQYRITDYSTTTSQPKTLSAGHDFDIIVVADSTNKLNENARAVQRVGDTYFNSSKVEAWQLKYSLDNDTTRFAWADTVNGKGVIYKMIDENNNECPYDFKNIQFLKDGIYYYTFTAFENTDETIKDASIMRGMTADDMVEGMTYNSMKPRYEYRYVNDCLQALNFNIFKSYYDEGSLMYMPSDHHFELNCYNNFFDGTEFTHNNTFGKNCSSNIFGNGCQSNIFGDACSLNIFGINCSSNTFGDACSLNTFGNNCFSNTLGNTCYSNTFGDACSSNTFGYNCSSNTLGNNIRFNTVGGLLKNVIVKNGVSGVNVSNRKDWTAVTALYNKDYPIEIWGYRESISVATTNTYRYFNATGTEIKGTF